MSSVKSAIPVFFVWCMCLWLWGCDPCAGTNCQNGGLCEEGTCNCTEPYEGIQCEVLERAKFVGSYSGGSGACLSNPDIVLPTHTISAATWSLRDILIEDGFHEDPILATVSGWNFTIPDQPNSYLDDLGVLTNTRIVGQGWIDEDAGELVYQLDNSGCTHRLPYPAQ